MTSQFIDAVSEERLNNYLIDQGKQHALYRTNATLQVAQAAATIYRNSPWLTPGQVLALSKASASPQATDLASQTQAKLVPQIMDPQKPKKQSWFERNVYDNVKETARWGFAALSLAPELAQNVASQIASPNDPAGWNGWFKSTSLGTMTGNSDEAGSGWFMAGTAAEKQAERARQFRGTINGHAWTVGRGAASAVFQPGSMQYNILSGFLDAAVNIYADPTLYAGEAIKAVRAGEEAKGLIGTRTISNALAGVLGETGLIKSAAYEGLKTANEISAARKIADAGTRALAGLTDAEQAAYDGSKFMQFFQQDRRAVRLVENLADPKNNNAYKILKDTFDYKIDLTTAKRLAEATTKDQIYAIIGEQSVKLGDISSNMIPNDIRQIRGAKWGTVAKERLGLYNNFRDSRLLTEVPDSLVIHGSSADRVKAVKDYGNYLNTIKGGFTDTDEGQKLMTQIFEAYADDSKAGVKKARDAFESTVKAIMVPEMIGDNPSDVKKSVADGILQQIFGGVSEHIKESRAYFVNEMGRPEDAGFVPALIKSGLVDAKEFSGFSPEQIDKLVMHGPGAVVELLDSAHVLPDIRAVRRVTGNPLTKALITKGKSADPREIVALTEYIQNKVWRPLTLATGGFVMRNMFDAQVRMAMMGKEGFFNHPLRYIQWVMGEKAPQRIVGRDFEQFVKDTAVNFEDITDGHAIAMTQSLNGSLRDVVPSQIRMRRTGNYELVDRMANPDKWLEGLRDEYIQISKDTISNGVAKGISTDKMIEYLRTDPKGRESLKQLERYLKEGVHIVDENGFSRKIKVTNVDDNVLREWIDRLAKGRVDLKTGGDQDLAFAIGHLRVPLDESFVAAADSIKPEQIIDGPKELGKGSLVDFGKDKNEMLIYGIVTDIGTGPSGNQLNIRRVSINQFSGKGVSADELARGRAELTKMIKGKAMGVYDRAGTMVQPPSSAKLPNIVKYAQRQTIEDARNPVDKMLKRGTDWFFHQIYENRVVNKLERSPVYRQFYYENVAKSVDSLTADEAKKLVEDVVSQASKIEMKPENYVGSGKNWKKIQQLASSANGTGTIKELDDYAALMALHNTKEALFDASNKNNLEDILRVVVPFGAAWREVGGTYLKALAEDPTRVRRAQLLFKGATDFDPDGNGRGFFYKDPTTNEYSFNFPLSGELSKLVTGIKSPLQGTVKRVSIGLDWHPALGPIGQIAASKIIPDTPNYDGIVSILMPYGRGGNMTLMPSWASKLKSALTDNPGKLNSIYGNTYIDTLRALSASGDYNLDTQEGQDKLMKDAQGKARILTAMRAIGQFVGPTSPGNEFEIPTKDGDMMASQLIKEFYKLQSNNYDTAVSEFLRIYGEDAILYLSSKSQATVGGLEATKEFGNWERNNGDVIKSFPDVAAYFAPGGSDFDFQVWQRQLNNGKRVRLTDKQVIDQAQYRVAASQYKAYRAQVGAYPTADQRAWLKTVREGLNAKYPGFPVVPVFTVGEFEKKIGQMKQAVADPRLKDNDVAKAINTYFTYRDQVLSQWIQSGGSAQGLATSKGAEPLRGYLTSIGDALALQVPDFGRVWERELLSEVDQ